MFIVFLVGQKSCLILTYSLSVYLNIHHMISTYVVLGFQSQCSPSTVVSAGLVLLLGSVVLARGLIVRALGSLILRLVRVAIRLGTAVGRDGLLVSMASVVVSTRAVGVYSGTSVGVSTVSM